MKDRVHQSPQIRFPQPPAGLGRRYQRGNCSPLTVRQIGWMAKAIPVMLEAGDTSPGHAILHILGRGVESQPFDITQRLSNQALRARCQWELFIQLSTSRSASSRSLP
eukprot:TRINITY_DN48504_c0_g1_i1.p1 TRINITY_DN48504_c0_g1~~TRINITY_DN48504_c0_g1_i1.p1  ORF type:complete len:108 (+),score=0.26 TRINITY_DN48504_c0_g1_i1:66-389(+)